MADRTFIPNPTGDLKTVTANSVVKVKGLDPVSSNLDTYGGPWECAPAPEGMSGCIWEAPKRQLVGKMRSGK